MICRPPVALLVCLFLGGCAAIAPSAEYCPLRKTAEEPVGVVPAGCTPAGPSQGGVTRLDCGSRTGFIVGGS